MTDPYAAQNHAYRLQLDAAIEMCENDPQLVQFADVADMNAYYPSNNGEAFTQCVSAWVLAIVVACCGWPTE